MKHPLAEEIKKWVDDPEAWQWQAELYDARPTPRIIWETCAFAAAMHHHSQGNNVRLIPNIPKRNLIPAHLLPEEWGVERNPAGTYFVKSPKFHGYVESERTTHNDAPSVALHQILRHIDPEAK